jgi:hypothetical protein
MTASRIFTVIALCPCAPIRFGREVGHESVPTPMFVLRGRAFHVKPYK